MKKTKFFVKTMLIILILAFTGISVGKFLINNYHILSKLTLVITLDLPTLLLVALNADICFLLAWCAEDDDDDDNKEKKIIQNEIQKDA